jgi:hypothetical protein
MNNTTTMQPTIEELRKQGYKVKVMHGTIDESDPHYNLSHRITTIKLRDLTGNEHIASAKCSKKDSYSRKLGNKIALGRVLKVMKDFYCNQ